MRLIKLKEMVIGGYDFSVVFADKLKYINFDDFLAASYIDDILARHILDISLHPPEGYYCLLGLKILPQNLSDTTGEIILHETPYIEFHGAIALLEMLKQLRPEDKGIVELIEALKKEFGYETKDDIVVWYILEHSWLERMGNK